jgi:integrase
MGNSLTRDRAQVLLNLPDTKTLKGKRDQAVLAVLLGAGLRRVEAAGLQLDQIQQRDGRWVITNLVGKHGRVRQIPIASWVKSTLDAWTEAAAISGGFVFRAISRGGRLQTRLQIRLSTSWSRNMRPSSTPISGSKIKNSCA